MAKRWQRRPEGSTWGDWGDDDELGRINLIGPEQVLKGVAEVQAGRSFCLSPPLDLPGGTALNQRRHPPRLAPTEDMDGRPDVFFNVHMSEMPDFGLVTVATWRLACRSGERQKLWSNATPPFSRWRRSEAVFLRSKGVPSTARISPVGMSRSSTGR